MTTGIFDITEITQHIAQFLAPADLALACRVHSSWFVPFAAELWRSIQPDQWTHGALVHALPRYSLYIRELRCSRFSSLDALGLDCTRLTLFRAPSIDLSNANLIADILRRNLDIEDLWLESKIPWRAVEVSMEYVDIIAGLQRLKKLSLLDFKVHSGTLVSLLEQLPGLESFSVEGWLEQQKVWIERSETEPDATEDLVGSTELPQQNQGQEEELGQGLPRLQSLHVDGSPESFESILKIVRLSPTLRCLSISETTRHTLNLDMGPPLEQFVQQVRTLCPELDHLRLFQSSITIEALQCLLSAFPRLRKLELLESEMLEHRDVLSVICGQHAYQDSLEEFWVNTEFQSRNQRLTSSLILWMLRRFPNLKRLSIKPGSIDAEEMARRERTIDDSFIDAAETTAVDASEVENGHDIAGHYEDAFVCKDLELLDVTIAGPDSNWAPRTAFAEEDWLDDDESRIEDEATPHPQSHNIYEAVMEQLQALPKLDLNSIRFTSKF